MENGSEGAMIVLDSTQGLHVPWFRWLSGVILRELDLSAIDPGHKHGKLKGLQAP
jgi:hypothetical protein